MSVNLFEYITQSHAFFTYFKVMHLFCLKIKQNMPNQKIYLIRNHSLLRKSKHERPLIYSDSCRGCGVVKKSLQKSFAEMGFGSGLWKISSKHSVSHEEFLRLVLVNHPKYCYVTLPAATVHNDHTTHARETESIPVPLT